MGFEPTATGATIAPVMARHSSRDATAIYVHLERVETMKEAQKMYR